jgi:glycosyltransferase involved in cell wall biosynthesis
MVSVLIKIKKGSDILKRDGFWNGIKYIGERIFRVLKMWLRWPKGEIIFISGLTGAVALYRTDYIAEELKECGFTTGVLYEDDPFLITKIKEAKVIILNRVAYNNNIKILLNHSEKNKQTIIYDTDDLIFDIELLKKTSSYKKLNNLEKKQYQKNAGLEILQSKQLSAVTTATSFLAEKLKKFNKPVFVVKNKLSKRELRWTREARKKYLRRINKDEDIKLGYFSGSISHDKDFAVILPALRTILTRYHNVKLCLVGYLEVGDEFYEEFKRQIIQLPFVPRSKHYQNIAEVDINLVPLEMNDFCQAKSELKFFEAGIIGVPTIATKNKTFSEAIDDGKNGILASSTDEWVQCLERLIDDKCLRIAIGEKARQKVLKKYLTNSGDNGGYYKFLKEAIKI